MNKPHDFEPTGSRGATVRNAAIGGSIAGGVLTLTLQLFALAFGHGETEMGWILLVPWLLAFKPATIFSKILGLPYSYNSVYDVSTELFILAVVINALLFSIIGVIAGWVVSVTRKRN
jgi:hypothetical protein